GHGRLSREIALSSFALCRLRHNLRINRDLHFVADDHTAGLEQLVPAQTKVLAIELAGCTETGAIIPVRILGNALERGIERDFFRHTVAREKSPSGTITVPVTSLKRPRTVAIIRCFTANSTCVCAGSTCHVVTLPRVAACVVISAPPRLSPLLVSARILMLYVTGNYRAHRKPLNLNGIGHSRSDDISP